MSKAPLGKPAKGAAKAPKDPMQLEQEMIRQAETRRRHEVLLRTRLQELMDEEEELSKNNARTIQIRWMEWLRSQKHKELTAAIEIIRHDFDKTLDRKNAVISMLSLDLEDAEEQYRLALRTHLDNVDALIDLQNRRMADLDIEFERDLLELRRSFELEKAEIIRKHEMEKADLKLILENMSAEAEREDRKLQEETSENHETATEKMDEDKKTMQGELQKLSEHLKNQITEKYDEFVNNANQQMKEYMEYTKKDEETADRIASQMRKIQKLQESIGNWKANLNNNIRECEERNNAMREEKEATARHYKELKVRMHAWRQQQEKRLNELVSHARLARNKLEKKSEKAERILKLSELCRGLETERERVLGFRNDVTSEEVQNEVAERMERKLQVEAAQRGEGEQKGGVDALLEGMDPEGNSGVSEALMAGAGEDWKLMENFWIKYNKVLLDQAAIGQEKHHLEHENEKLRALLKQYLDGISVNQDVMSQRNNLLNTKKIKSIVGTGAGAQNSRQVTVMEGNKVVCEVAKQRAY